jgi:4-amino-4-deoxy-L-arabinose transferase-like glycosyltransferase
LLGLYQQFGTNGLKFFFWTNNIGRITGTYTGNNNDFLFYIHTVGYLFLPFSLLTYFGAFQEIKNWVSGRFSFSNSREGITMAIPIFLAILSVSKMKSPHYMLPVIPLIAIITAKWTDRIMQEGLFSSQTSRILIRIQYVVMVVLIAGSLLIPTVFFPTDDLWFWIPVIMSIGFTVYVGLKSKTIADKLVYVPIMAILSVNLILTLHFFPQIFKYNATPIASRDFNKARSEKGTLFVMNNLDYEISFYAKSHPKVVSDSTLDIIRLVEDPWVYTDSLGRNKVLEEFPDAATYKHYKYKRISKIGLKFLMPAKRFNQLNDMYLINVKE